MMKIHLVILLRMTSIKLKKKRGEMILVGNTLDIIVPLQTKTS